MKHHVNEFVRHKGRTYRVALAPRHTPPKPLAIVRRSAIGGYDVGAPIEIGGKLGVHLVALARVQYATNGHREDFELAVARAGVAKAAKLSTNMRELLARIPDQWGPLPRFYDKITWRALVTRGLVEGNEDRARKTEAGFAIINPTLGQYARANHDAALTAQARKERP
jgi:hypothetical protein